MEDVHVETAVLHAAGKDRSDSRATEQFARLMKTEHWLKSYMTDLLGAHQANGLDFQTAELLLQQEKQAFENDLAIARRMYQLYPHMFRRDEPGTRSATTM